MSKSCPGEMRPKYPNAPTGEKGPLKCTYCKDERLGEGVPWVIPGNHSEPCRNDLCEKCGKPVFPARVCRCPR